jgi:hypothetical protein
VNALANEEVGSYFNKHFAAAFQKVGTFRIVNGQKQGGNVASYFCTPDGIVLHAIAGPVNAATLLKEARWVEETRKRAALECRNDPRKMPAFYRQAHAERLEQEHQLWIDWRRVPLSMPVIAFAGQYLHREGAGLNPHGPQLDNQGKVHALLAVYPLVKIENLYKVVFERVLGERISTAPVKEDGGGR